jgi:threonyl-tRNA synthetase
MVTVKLLDGTILECKETKVDGFKVAEQISSSLAKAAIAMEVDGKLCDMDCEISGNAKVVFITAKDDLGLEIIRHDTAHILAEAIKELYPTAEITIGPTIKDGFYYDISYSETISIDDFPKIEQKMHEIIKRNQGFIRKVVSRDEAIKMFEKAGEQYKVQLIRDLPQDEEISLYYHGDFFDLCRGPHGPNTRHLKAFKLTKISGAYWRGDSNNAMLQRIYGTAWRDKNELDLYLHMLEEAEKRDHRKLGKEMDLFHFQDNAPGVVFWHAKGWQIFQTLMNFIRNKQIADGYIEVSTPELLCRSIWEKSGHWDKFKENMFTAHAIGEDREYAIKPMSCPGAVQIYNHGLTSYRDLPLKMAEFGKVHRFEPSGALHGLMRVRGFTQDDAHIFCTEDQIQDESRKVCEFALSIYKECGFDNVKIKISDRPDKRIGSDIVWDKSEKALIQSVESMGLSYEINKGEGAFYGPKIEFTLTDAIGRDWQIGTLQVDFNLPMRFEAHYIGSDGQKHHPIMLHRAILGSLERFIGIMLEHHSGKLPLWLAPIQVVILPVSEQFNEYAAKVAKKLRLAGIKLEVDNENQTLNYKLRKHILAKSPLIVIIGRNEELNNTVTVRRSGSDEQTVLTVDNFVDEIQHKLIK